MTGTAASRPDRAGWSFGLLVAAIAVANLVLVHPVPAIAYAILSLAFLPPANRWLWARGVGIPAWLKVALAIALVVFTLGVSDLGDMLD